MRDISDMLDGVDPANALLKNLRKTGMHQNKGMLIKRLSGKSLQVISDYAESLRAINRSPLFDENDQDGLPLVPDCVEGHDLIQISERYWDVLYSKIPQYEKKAILEAVKNVIMGVPLVDIGVINLLDRYTRDDLYEFFNDTSIDELKLILRKPLSADLLQKINDILMEKEFAKTLQLFEFSNELLQTRTTRIIITDFGVCDALRIIYNYKQENGALSTLGAVFGWIGDMATYSTLRSLELAWGLLSSLSKHEKEYPFITSSLATAKWAIAHLGANATIVLDGHGGNGCANIANYKYYANAPLVLSTSIQHLLECDESQNIDHIILQTCASGQLVADKLLVLKRGVLPNKQRATFFASKDTVYSGLLIDNTIANGVYAGIVAASRHHNIAFTFSENLINPDDAYGNGNVGFPKKADRDDPRLRKTYKSITIVPDEEHRKSPLTFEKVLKLYEREEFFI